MTGPARRALAAALGLAGGLLAAEFAARALRPEAGLAQIAAPGARPMPPDRLRPSGSLGWERTPGGDARFDADGFRSRRLGPARDAFRLLVVGDSLADALTERYLDEAAERRLSAATGRPVHLWDFAAGGYNAAQYGRILDEKTKGRSFDALLVVFCLNDLYSRYPMYFRLGDELAPAAGLQLDGESAVNPALFRLSHLYRVLALERARRKAAASAPPLAGAPMLDAFLDRALAWGAARRAPVYFALFPYLKAPSDYTAEQRKQREDFLSAFARRGLPLLWLHDRLPPEYWKRFRTANPLDEIHPTGEGYEAAAEAIVRYLEEGLGTDVLRGAPRE